MASCVEKLKGETSWNLDLQLKYCAQPSLGRQPSVSVKLKLKMIDKNYLVAETHEAASFFAFCFFWGGRGQRIIDNPSEPTLDA